MSRSRGSIAVVEQSLPTPDESNSPPKEPDSHSSTPQNESPPVFKRRPSLIRASSFDSPPLCFRRASLRSEVLRLRCESQDTAEEDDLGDKKKDLTDESGGSNENIRENEKENEKGKSYSNESSPVPFVNGEDVPRPPRERRRSVHHERSLELDSPSNAAVPIVEVIFKFL